MPPTKVAVLAGPYVANHAMMSLGTPHSYQPPSRQEMQERSLDLHVRVSNYEVHQRTRGQIALHGLAPCTALCVAAAALFTGASDG